MTQTDYREDLNKRDRAGFFNGWNFDRCVSVLDHWQDSDEKKDTEIEELRDAVRKLINQYCASSQRKDIRIAELEKSNRRLSEGQGLRDSLISTLKSERVKLKAEVADCGDELDAVEGLKQPGERLKAQNPIFVDNRLTAIEQTGNELIDIVIQIANFTGWCLSRHMGRYGELEKLKFGMPRTEPCGGSDGSTQ